MRLTFIRGIVKKDLVLRGLRISPRFLYGVSLTSDIQKLWSDLDLDAPHTIVDIGANIGNFSRDMNSYFRQARILAVEPNSDLLKALTRIPGLEVVNAAISASSGAAMLNIFNVNGVEDTPLSSS